MQDNTETLDSIKRSAKQNTCDVEILKGLAQKQENEINLLKDKITKLTARSMSSNIVVSGIMESKQEDSKKVVFQFITEIMELMEINESDILAAH